jgi:hypothetical protein
MSYREETIQLELKDRIPYQKIIEKKLYNLSDLISNSKTPFQDIQHAILDLLTGIPDSWKDREFEIEMKSVIKHRRIDVRPSFAGYKLSIKHCIENKIPHIMLKPQIDYFKLKNAIINLLDRLDLLVRKKKIEYSTGKNVAHTLEDLDSMYGEELEEEIENVST